MENQQPQGNGSTILMVIVASLLAFGLGWFVGSNNGNVDSGDQAAAIDIDGVELADSDILPVGDSPVMGNPNAPVTIVEFTSMQCPHCSTGNDILHELVEKYPEEIRVVFKHFPLQMQQQARPATIAAEAAHRQDKFWEMKSALFDRIRDYGNQEMEELGAELAADLDMDVDQFREDFNDPEIAERVDRDMELGGEVGVRGTPHFFVNGVVVNGAQPVEAFSRIIEEELEKVGELDVESDQIYAAAIEAELGSAAPDAAPQPDRPEQPAPAEQANVQEVDVQDHDHVRGASEEDALVTIMEFSSFQCPHCARGSETLSQLLEKYPDEVRVVFKHFPLSFQQQSEPASRAAVAAGNQDKFWEMYELLYENQRSLSSDGLFERLAEEIGLNMDRFRTDFDAPETAKIVSDSQAEGRSAGIQGTPGFLINGLVVTGAQPLNVFENHVKEQIEIANEVKGDSDVSGDELYAAIVEHNKEEAGAAAPAPAEREQPTPTAIDADELSIEDYTAVRGADDAAVTIFEYSSFQCPFCGRAADTMDELLEEYDGDVRHVYKTFPLPFQDQSEPAARAAHAAGEQGKFWEMHELLYENQQSLGQNGIFEQLAEELGLDMNQYRQDFDSDVIAERVETEQAEGQGVGVRGTPGFFINGENVSGARPIEDFRAIIDKHLDS